MNGQFTIKANLGLVVRGEVSALKAFASAVQTAIDDSAGDVQLVFKTVSGSRLWIKEGDRDG